MTAKHGIEAAGGDNLTQGQDLQVVLCHGKKSPVGTQSWLATFLISTMLFRGDARHAHSLELTQLPPLDLPYG